MDYQIEVHGSKIEGNEASLGAGIYFNSLHPALLMNSIPKYK